ncbi:spore germination protein KB [Paenibacillus rhizosphaerae]|uniref:Spore germination protein KB n=1 Tax=Paenibacillus rhizosphaerae TaxID=297318 RepID=A0A839TNX1_9BACL|nr:endospore germination permease [Paenibacillus rhizosphaerae]MBB3128465.1 spore germination protein KB [Paenibacillus rhizosphaerae]
MENATLSQRQFLSIVIFTTISTAFYLLPGVLIADAKQYAWLVPIWTGFAGVGISLLWLYLASQYPKVDLFQISHQVLGRVAGKIVSIFLIYQMILICSWVINNLNDFMTITLLTHTTDWVFGACFLMIAVYSTIKGIEALARTTEFFVPLLILMIFLFFSIAVNVWDWSHFTPVSEIDWEGVFPKSSFMIAFPFMDAFTFIMIFPYVKEKPGLVYLKGSLIGALFLSAVTFLIIGTLGVSRASHIAYPLYTLSQELELSPFLEHIEGGISIFWLIFVFIKLMFTFYCAVTGIAQTFNIQHRGLISVPLAIVILGFSQSMHQNIIENIEWMKKYILQQESLVSVVIPALLIVVHFISRRRRT